MRFFSLLILGCSSCREGEDMEVPIYGSTLLSDVRAQFNTTTVYFHCREDVLRVDLDKGIEDLNAQI